MKITTYLLASALMLSLLSCKTDAADAKEIETPEHCFYSYNEGSTKLEWTAYKTSERVGVPGGFNEITVTSENGESPIEVLESIQFSLKTSSVETNNEDRNGKIAKHFFDVINTDVIEGSIKSVDTNGNAVISIIMNGVTIDVKGECKLDGNNFEFKAEIDVSLWNGIEGIKALNEICKDLHTGTDGVSKLWSEVDLLFSTTLKSDCD